MQDQKPKQEKLTAKELRDLQSVFRGFYQQVGKYSVNAKQVPNIRILLRDHARDDDHARRLPIEIGLVKLVRWES